MSGEPIKGVGEFIAGDGIRLQRYRDQLVISRDNPAYGPTDTINVLGMNLTGNFTAANATLSGSIKTSDLITKGPWVDVRSFMDGVAGRPTYATWVANYTTTNIGQVIQASHDALPSDGGIILIPPALSYLISTQVNFTKPVMLIGGDVYSSELVTDTAGLTMFTTTTKLVVRNIGFTATGSAAGTAIAIKTLSSALNHAETIIEHNYFQGFSKCYWSQRTASIHVKDNRFSPGGTGRCGLYLENLTTPDEGDSFIHNNYFAGGTGETSILVASTSGLNISNNKFNGAVAVHVDIAPTTNAVGNFLINGNSFEGQVTAAIRLVATTGSITKTIINGNQFSSGVATQIIVGKYAKNTTITGNTFNSTDSTGGIGIDIQTDSENTTITGNEFYQILTAINSTANIVGQTISGNRFTLSNNATLEVTNFYLVGENDVNLNGPGSTKDFQVDRFISNLSNSTYVNAFQLKGNCIVEVFVTGMVQGAGVAQKYRKVLVTGDTTITNLIPLVSVGSTFDLQVASSGGYTVIGIKRNGATGTSVTMQVRVKINGYVRDFSRV